ncbi:MAG: thiamine pyrophosphate-binding protein [Proteobacteria bacterium]|nr:thiamine pyrophosphate-binding protein [Pseudomonadota bacterium]
MSTAYADSSSLFGSDTRTEARSVPSRPTWHRTRPPLSKPHTGGSTVIDFPLKVRAVEECDSAARQLATALVEAGVDTFFGIPGGPISPVFDAVLQVKGARLIESRHESSAAFAAAGYFRASGKVPAVVVTAGPGATNAITGITSAHLERVPMIVICGDVAGGGAKLLQDSGPSGIGVERMLAPVTRATIRMNHPGSAVAQAIAALQAATDPWNAGPALLVVPIDRGRARTPDRRIEPVVSRRVGAVPRREVVEETCSMLARARRPLLVLGNGCRQHPQTIRRLVDAIDIPFVTTPQAKGVVSEEHPRSLRHGGLAASQWARHYTASGVDVAVVLGSDLDDCSVGPTPYVADGGKLIHVDLDPTVFNRGLPAEIAVVADLSVFAEMMYEEFVSRGLRNERCPSLIAEVRSDAAFDVPSFADDDATIITPARAIADIERAAPDDTVFVTDIGQHMLFALHYLTARGPDRFRIGLSLGSMGSGIAAAIGMAIARPERPVVCICGDGGMQMAGMELLVALTERLPIIYAVFNDARYNMVYHGFKQIFGREEAWESPWIDFAGWARSMGMAGIRINHPGEIDAQLVQQLVAARIPAVLDIRIDRDVCMKGGGRNEALQRMSLVSES